MKKELGQYLSFLLQVCIICVAVQVSKISGQQKNMNSGYEKLAAKRTDSLPGDFQYMCLKWYNVNDVNRL